MDHAADSRDWVERWLQAKQPDWHLTSELGCGGTAVVYEVTKPCGGRLALKVHNRALSQGDKLAVEQKRVDLQVTIGNHFCPSLIRVLEGGLFDERLYVLMEQADGKELAKCIHLIPRDKIRKILAQVADAVLFLDSQGLCHRDIKAENIFITNDYDRVTLLDLSVVRYMQDPIGLGTDQSGQLPIVATARYSPPEYLFRLLEPGPTQWHALNVYQMGCLLHDLIMREQIFEKEYAESKANRYRFAWIVATVEPTVEAVDVPLDLQVLARRALDKAWQRRSRLRIENFRDDTRQLRSNALRALGMGKAPSLDEDATDVVTTQLVTQRFRETARAVEATFTAILRDEGVTAEHDIKQHQSDGACDLMWKWRIQEPMGDFVQVFYFVSMHLTNVLNGGSLYLKIRLGYGESDAQLGGVLDLPAVRMAVGVEDTVSKLLFDSLAELATVTVGARKESA